MAMEDGGKKKRFGLSLKSSKNPASNNAKNRSFGEYFTKLQPSKAVTELNGYSEENKEDNKLCISDTRMKLLDLMPVFPDWRKIKPLPLNPTMIKSLSNPKKVDSNQSNCEMDGKSEKIELNNNDTTKPLNNDGYKALPKLSMQYFTQKVRQQSLVTLDNSREDDIEMDSPVASGTLEFDPKPRHKLTEGYTYDTNSAVDGREPDSRSKVEKGLRHANVGGVKYTQSKNVLVVDSQVAPRTSGFDPKPTHKLTEGFKYDTNNAVDEREPHAADIDAIKYTQSKNMLVMDPSVATGMSGFDPKPRHKPKEEYAYEINNAVEGREPNSRSKVEKGLRHADVGGVKYTQSKNVLVVNSQVAPRTLGFDPKPTHKLTEGFKYDTNNAVDEREPHAADIDAIKYTQSKNMLVMDPSVATGMSGFDPKPRHKLKEEYAHETNNAVEGREPNSRSMVGKGLKHADNEGVKYTQNNNVLVIDPLVAPGTSEFNPKPRHKFTEGHTYETNNTDPVDRREPNSKRKVEKGLGHADIERVKYSQSKNVLVEEKFLPELGGVTKKDRSTVFGGGVSKSYPDLTQGKDVSDGQSVPKNKEVSARSSEKMFAGVSSNGTEDDEVLARGSKKSGKTESGSMKYDRGPSSQSSVVCNNDSENPGDSRDKNFPHSSGLFKEGKPLQRSVNYGSSQLLPRRPVMCENSGKKKTDFGKYDNNDSTVCQIVLSDDDEQERETIQFNKKNSSESSYLAGHRDAAKKVDNTNGELGSYRSLGAFDDDKRNPSCKDGNLSPAVLMHVDKRTSVPVHRKGQGSPRSPLVINDNRNTKCAAKFSGAKSSQSRQLFDNVEREPTKDTKSGKPISSMEKFKYNDQWKTDYMTHKGSTGRYTERETNQMKNRGGKPSVQSAATFQSTSKNTLSESSKGAAVRTGVSNNATRTHSAGVRTEETSFDSVKKSPYTSIPYKKELNSKNQRTFGKDEGGIREGGWGAYKGTEDKNEDQWLTEELLKEDDDLDDLISSLGNDLDDDDLVSCCDDLMSPTIPVRDNKSVSRKLHSSMKADTHISSSSKGVKRRLELPEGQSKIKRANSGSSNSVSVPGLASPQRSTSQTRNNPGGNGLSECPICLERFQCGLFKQDIDKHIAACLGGEEMVNDDDELFW